MPGEPDRYHRQTILTGFGPQAQERLRNAHALVVGCGALGCAAIDLLARAGVGALTLVDRDVVELTNLQRQTLYTQTDADQGTPKAEAAKRRVAQVNPQVRVHACVEHLDADNAADFVRDCTVIVDGLDNYHTRYVLNDAAVRMERPYVYAGAVGMRGMSMPVLAGVAQAHGLRAEDAPCLRCLFPELPPPGGETCDTAGVFGPLVAVVGAYAAAQAIKIMAELHAWVDGALWQIDMRANRVHTMPLAGARNPACPCCGARRFEFLEADAGPGAVVLCGRNAVQVRPLAHLTAGGGGGSSAARARGVDLAVLQERLRAHGEFTRQGGMLMGRLNQVRTPEGAAIELTIFEDGRAIVRGSTDTSLAQSVYDRFVGG